MARRQDDYAKNQRKIRSAQPKVSSDEAHARARRALAVNSQLEAQEPRAADTAKPTASRNGPDHPHRRRVRTPSPANPRLGPAARTPDRPPPRRPPRRPRRRGARGLPGRHHRPLAQADHARQGRQGTPRPRGRRGRAPDPAHRGRAAFLLPAAARAGQQPPGRRLLAARRDPAPGGPADGGLATSHPGRTRHAAGEIAQHFVTAGYEPVNAKTFYQPEKNLLVSDAHTANVFRTPLGVAPFDVCVQQPRDALRRAVEPAPTLRFDDWGDDAQAGLGF